MEKTVEGIGLEEARSGHYQARVERLQNSNGAIKIRCQAAAQ
jgi:hypothetical protein